MCYKRTLCPVFSFFFASLKLIYKTKSIKNILDELYNRLEMAEDRVDEFKECQ